MSEVQRTLCSIPNLHVLSYSKSRVKQVVNFATKTKCAKVAPPQTEQTTQAKVTNWLDDFDDPCMRSNTSKRNEWNPEDMALLKEAFKDFSELPSTTQIRTVINGDMRLQRLLDASKRDHVYNKLKSMFRKTKK